MKAEYIKLECEKPKNVEKVLVSTIDNPMNPKFAVFKKGRFFDLSDNQIEYFPKFWKYPNVPLFI